MENNIIQLIEANKTEEVLKLLKNKSESEVNELLNNSQLNAKIRRKIKRLIEFNPENGEGNGEEKEEQQEGNTGNNQEKKDVKVNSMVVLDSIKECLNVLKKKSFNEVEEAIGKLPIAEFTVQDNDVMKLTHSLNEFMEENNEQMNAKFRRRVKRMLEMLANLSPGENLSGNTRGQATREEDEAEDIVMNVVEKVSLPRTLELLTTANKFRDVEYALNSMQLPDIKSFKDNSDGIV